MFGIEGRWVGQHGARIEEAAEARWKEED